MRSNAETPPLTRGRPAEIYVGRKRARNTPAYAGKTSGQQPHVQREEKHPRLRGEDFPSVTSNLCFEKHPRLRGEDDGAARVVDALVETPPLTRGRRRQKGARARPAGNTPAYAGKTTSSKRRVRLSRETPPLTRGRPSSVSRTVWGFGNTPAYAGKTGSAAWTLS